MPARALPTVSAPLADRLRRAASPVALALAGFAAAAAIVPAGVRAAETTAAPAIERLNPEGLTKPRGYSQVVVASGTRWIHVAGQGGVRLDGTVPGDVGEQARLMFEKVRIALAAAGAGPEHVVRIVVYIVDLGRTDPAPVYAAIREFFPEGSKPASSIVGISGLALPGMKVEIDVTAVR